MTPFLLESDVMNACRVLFGPGPDIGKGFLSYLQPSGAKSAYRKRAKETHPDFYHAEDTSTQQQQTALFRAIMDAYDTINRFFQEREKGLWRPVGASTFRTDRRRAGTGDATAPQSQTDYYQGPVPGGVLELGRYLFYTGCISYGELIEALAWQRMQRPVIGSIALRWSWLSKESIERILDTHPLSGRFGEKAVRLGMLTDFQVRVLLYYQRTLQERLGGYFIQKGSMTTEDLDRAVAKKNEHNAHARASKKATHR